MDEKKAAAQKLPPFLLPERLKYPSFHVSPIEELLNQPDCEYYGLMASTWDLLAGDTSNVPDKSLYRDLIQKYGQPALDVGCGTGRLLMDYLQAGLDVDGVDISPEMLAICRQKAQKLGLHPAIYEQSMQSLDLPRCYRTIFVPSSTFQLLTDPASAGEAMGRFFRHLEPGGILVLSFMSVWHEGDRLEIPFVPVGEMERPEDGTMVRKWWSGRLNPEKQIIEQTIERYEVVLNGQVTVSEDHLWNNALRWYTKDQAIALFQVAGFKNIQLFDDFPFQKSSDQSDLCFALGQR